jgi:tetratricopeptide (TPR) repeat protein
LRELAGVLEAQGQRAEAVAAMQQALRLAPGDLPTLLQASAHFLRAGADAQALATLRRAVDAARGDVSSSLWNLLLEQFDGGRQQPFFDGLARDNPAWWPVFFRLACERAANRAALLAVYATRVAAAVATPADQRGVLERLQRDGQWSDAYRLWSNALPRDQQDWTGAVFNGGFERAISSQGFDWQVPPQPGVEVGAQPMEGMTGRAALRVAFAGTRYSAPPLYQYLVLWPGRYRLQGRGRSDLDSWLGLQWGLYCQDAAGREPRQLARSERFVGALDWRVFQQEFEVPADCVAQVLRLELANPRSDAAAPGAVVVRLRGTVWFDDLRVDSLTAEKAR